MSTPREKPILMSAPMVQALLVGTKTQTRRIVKSPHLYNCIRNCGFVCPYGVIGDHLWVKETHAPNPLAPAGAQDSAPYCLYRANGDGDSSTTWRPSIFMKRSSSRITLKITDVRAEKLQEITKDDAKAEGLELVACGGHPGFRNYRFETAHPSKRATITDQEHRIVGYESPVASYQSLWESINGVGSWESNPWVFVITFRKL